VAASPHTGAGTGIGPPVAVVIAVLPAFVDVEATDVALGRPVLADEVVC
jgi:hypothetical protein